MRTIEVTRFGGRDGAAAHPARNRAAFAITAAGGVFSAHGAASGDFTALDEHAARPAGVELNE